MRSSPRTRHFVTAAVIAFTIAACVDQPPNAPSLSAPTTRPNSSVGNLVVIQLVTDGGEACALKSDNTIVCWGGGELRMPFGTGRHVYLDAGIDGFGGGLCALKEDQSATCLSPQFDTPPAGAFSRIAAGARQGCALRADNTMACWGDDDFAGETVAQSGTFTRIDAGGGQNCAIRTNGDIVCWGANGGVGLDEDQTGPFIDLSVGWAQNCAIRATGALLCWGYEGEREGMPTGTFIHVNTRLRFSCAVRTTFALACWGQDTEDPRNRLLPPPTGSYTQVAVGVLFACAVNSNGKVVCWGARSNVEDEIPADIAGPRSTTTTLAASPSPSGFGQSVTFTATVTGGTAAASGGTVTFIEGGTCDAPTTTHASNVGLVAGGKASFATTTLALGIHTLTACYSGAANFFASEGSVSHTVDPRITVTVNPTSQQYSDRVNLSATVTPAEVNGSSATGSVQFKIAGANVGSPVTLGAGGTASLSNVQVITAQGTRLVEAVFTSTNSNFNSSTGSTNLTVTREDATVVYDAANPAALEVSAPGGSLNANALSLTINAKEKEPDVAVSPGTTGVGSIANAGLSVTLLPVGPGTTYTLACTAGSVAGTGYAATQPFTCTNPVAIAVNVYEVRVSVTGDYYTGSFADAFTVFDPSLGFVTGGGTFLLGGDRARFGITTKYKKNGDGAKGSLIVVRRHADGTSSTLTSNALAGLALGEDPTVPMGWSALNGKATYTRWDAGTNSYVTVGGQSFTFYVEDRGDPGTGVDRIWVGGPALLSLPGTPSTARTNAVLLTGGNVAVPHAGAK